MQRDADGVVLSASDLANHLACRHLSELDHRVALGTLGPPAWRDAGLELLRERGLRHERAYVEHLRAQGLRVVDAAGDGDAGDGRAPDAHARTAAALRDGADVVVQAALRDGRWQGYADVLRRVEEPSELGRWSYEIVDTKLAQQTRGGTVLQLCLYADLLAPIQGRAAARMHVVKPGDGFPAETFRYEEHAAYYRWVRGRLEAVVARDGSGRHAHADGEHYPEPVPHCEVCRWWSRCDRRRRDDDHLSLVAGMTTLHGTELRRQGLGTLESFADAPSPLREAPQRGHRDTYAALQQQAAIQLRRRRTGELTVELLPHAPDKGLARLPEPSAGDVFLDFEGDPFVDGGGLEYLLGYAVLGDGGALPYTGAWALDRAAEKRAFEAFVDFVIARLALHPGLHVYHFAPYEPAALKRLASRHATREAELDELLRAERFVDLHLVVRQGLRAGVESYSLKPLEEYFGYARAVDLREEAAPALRRVACALELGVPGEVTADDRRAVEGYNRDDCLSLVALQRWLERQRDELVRSGAAVTRPPLRDGTASQRIEERGAEVAALFERLVRDVPPDPAARSPEQRARWLLAHLLDYFRREERVSWWEYFARRDGDHDERLSDRKVLVGLHFECALPLRARERNPVHRYRFPPQEADFDPGDDVYDADGPDPLDCAVGTVRAFDPGRQVIDIKRVGSRFDEHPSAVHVFDHVPAQAVGEALLAVARAVAEHGIDAPHAAYPASRRLLLREPPSSAVLVGHVPRESPLQLATRAVGALDGEVLAIQGPPGAGKTYVGARLILALARRGLRVGISATSHKVIRNLLGAIVDAAREERGGEPVRVVHKINKDHAPTPVVGIEDIGDASRFGDAVRAGAIGGGVAWTWARDDLDGALDHLVIDEAGQMSLAVVLAVSRAARNLVLLGDPLQLQQPQRGAHPEGAEVSALDHLLGEDRTIREGRGIFLTETWRLPPAICDYTSEVFYERRLRPREGCERQRLTGPTRFAGAGLHVVPVEHAGNQSASPEEVETVARAVGDLLQPGVGWIDAAGDEHALTAGDVLVVAPYNAQVAALARRMPEIAVGTVDRFQGQQAPVVVYSMTSSSPQDAPRGMSFLYDPHRLNVATSRARCAAILVASLALFEPECRTPEQVRQASALCRFRELAQVVELSTAAP